MIELDKKQIKVLENIALTSEEDEAITSGVLVINYYFDKKEIWRLSSFLKNENLDKKIKDYGIKKFEKLTEEEIISYFYSIKKSLPFLNDSVVEMRCYRTLTYKIDLAFIKFIENLKGVMKKSKIDSLSYCLNTGNYPWFGFTSEVRKKGIILLEKLVRERIEEIKKKIVFNPDTSELKTSNDSIYINDFDISELIKISINTSIDPSISSDAKEQIEIKGLELIENYINCGDYYRLESIAIKKPSYGEDTFYFSWPDTIISAAKAAIPEANTNNLKLSLNSEEFDQSERTRNIIHVLSNGLIDEKTKREMEDLILTTFKNNLSISNLECAFNLFANMDLSEYLRKGLEPLSREYYSKFIEGVIKGNPTLEQEMIVTVRRIKRDTSIIPNGNEINKMTG